MRIGIDATCWWNRRGFGRFTRGVLGALAATPGAQETTLLVDRVPAPGELPPGFAVVEVRPRRTVTASAVAAGRRSLGDLLRFTAAVRRLRPDVFFFPAAYSFFPLPPGQRAVVCIHDTLAERFPELVLGPGASRWAWRMKMRLAVLQARRVMTVSQASRDDIVREFGVPARRIDVVTEGADSRFRKLDASPASVGVLSRLGIVPGEPFFLHVGGFSPHKNLGTLLDAMRLLLRDHAARLVLVGDLRSDGFMAEGELLRQRVAADPALAHATLFTGFLPDDDLPALYTAALACTMTALGEGFGLPALEAMACGTPVLASRVGSLPEVVGDAGILFDPQRPPELAAAMARILDDPALRADLGARALERSRLYSWERAAALVLASLEAAAG